MQVVMPPLDELLRDVEKQQRRDRREPRFPWTEGLVRSFVEYCVLVLESAPEDLRERVVSSWRRGAAELVLHEGVVEAFSTPRPRSGIAWRTQDWEQGHIHKPDSYEQDDLLAAGWRSAAPLRLGRTDDDDWFPPLHLKHPAFPL